jgi:two-component system LytT family response regulator
VSACLRVIVADDERPAQAFLVTLLRSFDDVQVVGVATSGREAVALIQKARPDLALLDWQMPELDGMGVVKALKKNELPLIAFVTAYDEHAVRAFEANAIDYLLKPVERARLREALNRAHERMEHAEMLAEQTVPVGSAVDTYEAQVKSPYLERIPVRQREEVVLVPVAQVASIVAEAELLHITTSQKSSYTITYRLKDLEQRLDPSKFIRLGRGTLANVEFIVKVKVMPGGTYEATLSTGQTLQVSRGQSRVLRHTLLRLS